MIKVTWTAIVIVISITGVAYLYLPEPKSQPIAEERSSPKPPRRESDRTAEAEDPFGGSLMGLAILAVVVMSLKTISE